MILFPSRSGALTLVLAAGFGLLFCGPSATLLSRAAAQSGDAAPTVSTAQPAGASMARTDAQGRHLAPHGTFYLLDYVPVTTDTGVDGLVPGQEVHVVSADRSKHTLLVTDGKVQAEMEPSKLTNDIDIAAMVRRQDQSNQARVAAYVQAEQAAFAKHEREEAETEAKNDENRRLEAQQAADARMAAQSAQNAPQPVDASLGNGAGYYDAGGYGYGSPYSYFSGSGVVVAGPNRAAGASGRGGGRDTLPSDRASTNSADVERGGSGAAAGGAHAGGAGGHPGVGGGKP